MQPYYNIVIGAILLTLASAGEPRLAAGESPSSFATAAVHSTLDDVRKRGVVIIGIGQEAPPFGYMDAGQLTGFDVEIARAVAARLETYTGTKVKLQFRPVTDETRISWVQSGEIDMSLCHTNITRKRLANIDFTVPYGWDGKGVMYDSSKGQSRELSSFAGKAVGIKRSSSSEGEIQAYFAAQGWAKPQLRQFDSHIAGIQAVIDGQIEGFTDDNSIITNTATKAGHTVGPGGDLAISTGFYSDTYFGIGVRQNDSRWRNILTFCLHDLWKSGEYQKIYDKWFGPKSSCPIPLGRHQMEPFVNG